MGVEIIENEYHKALFCNTTCVAFGPVFSSDDDVEEFLQWLPLDAREYDNAELQNKFYEFNDIRTIKLGNIDRTSIEIEGIDFNDYPKFCDAYISEAKFNDGTELTDEQLDELTDEHGEIINEIINEIIDLK